MRQQRVAASGAAHARATGTGPPLVHRRRATNVRPPAVPWRGKRSAPRRERSAGAAWVRGKQHVVGPTRSCAVQTQRSPRGARHTVRPPAAARLPRPCGGWASAAQHEKPEPQASQAALTRRHKRAFPPRASVALLQARCASAAFQAVSPVVVCAAPDWARARALRRMGSAAASASPPEREAKRKSGRDAFGAGAAAGMVTRRVATLHPARAARASPLTVPGATRTFGRAPPPRSALLQPFDVIKTRLQAQAAGKALNGCGHSPRGTKAPPNSSSDRSERATALRSGARRGMVSIAQTIARTEGVRALWSGVGPACIRVGGGAGAARPRRHSPACGAQAPA